MVRSVTLEAVFFPAVEAAAVGNLSVDYNVVCLVFVTLEAVLFPAVEAAAVGNLRVACNVVCLVFVTIEAALFPAVEAAAEVVCFVCLFRGLFTRVTPPC